MSRLQTTFQHKKKQVLNVYCTAGFPTLESTLPVMKALQKNGADIIELGMPYSDPIADGETIQTSSAIALANGMSIATLFEQLQDLRKHIHIPVVLMGYMNPILQFGFEAFCAQAAAVGIDGLILPDLPEFEFKQTYQAILKKYALDFIFLVTPETSEERVKSLDQLSSGFLYAVSSSATTGGNAAANMKNVATYLKRLKSYQLQNPVLAGFGIKDKESFQAVCKYTQGAIIGSAYIQALLNNKNATAATKKFLDSVLV